VEHFWKDVENVLNQVDEVDRLRGEIRHMMGRIQAIKTDDLEEWNAFVATVCRMHEEIMRIAPQQVQPVSESLNRVRQDLTRTREDRERELDAQLREIREQIRIVSSHPYRLELARQLRVLANQIESGRL
jgi:uncharacterized pyridoxal phosphate-containing UPF0001 family protein